MILRVWMNRNGKNTYLPVANCKEAQEIINAVAVRDLKNDSIIFNAFGLEEFKKGEWTEWYSMDGQDILEVMDSEDN